MRSRTRHHHHHHHRRKESKHYQESDILESPSVYCRSNLGDKISDYEDLWTQENSNNSRSSLHIALDTTTTTPPKSDEAKTPLAVQCQTPLAGNEIAITTKSNSHHSPPLQTTKQLYETKRSPFYSDPVDVVPLAAQIVRREPKVNILPSFHRYSEPPKAQFDEMGFPSSPVDMDKSFTSSIAAGSLDQLKRLSSRPINNNHRLDPTWMVDSSWEFVDKNDDSSESSSRCAVRQPAIVSRSSSRHRRVPQQQQHQHHDNNSNSVTIDSYLMNSKKPTTHKLVAKRYPDISLKVTPPQQSSSSIPSTWQTFDSDSSSKFQRLSSYDNVEQHSIYGGNSAASEDGTLFSEPWDSSQWDSFMPTTDGN